jgi:Carboxypeptidase regulatory-like domain/TonB dependent receptor
MSKSFLRTTLVLFFTICVGAIIPSITNAQSGTGTISGKISDATGAILPGATVTAKNNASGVETTRQTTDTGLFVISALLPGEYTVTAKVNGFQTLIQGKVFVDALGTTTLNLSLKAGNIAETVTIEDAPAQLNTSDARLGTTIRNETYAKLPLAMGTSVAGFGIGQGPRNPGAFIFLLPGVSEGNRNGTINGGQGFSKEIFIEGVPITDAVTQGEGRTLALGVSVESIEQFQVETSGTGVEFSGQGAENYTIKSGGSKFHATGFEYLRNTALNARGFFPAIRPVEHQNEFGFTVGGPIKDKKLFFFASYDGWKYRVTSPTQLVSVPTLNQRVGDFFGVANIYDPLSTICVGNVCTRTQFSDPTRATAANPTGINIIPLARLSAISKVYQAALPTPTNSNLTNNFLGQVPVKYNNTSYNLKIDYNLTENQRISGIYTRGHRDQAGGFYREVSPADPGSALPLPYTSTRLVEEIPTVFQLKHNWSISSNLVNTISYGYQRLYVPLTTATSADKWSAKSGLAGLPVGDARDAFLEASFTGQNSPTNWRGVNARDFEDDLYNYTLQDTLLYVTGNHSFKFGGQYQKTKDVYKQDDTGSLFIAAFNSNQTAGFNAGGSTLTTGTGHAYASYLLGALGNTGTIIQEDTVAGVTPTTAQFYSYAMWAADDWKVSQRLTLNLGLRYDIAKPYTEKDNHFSYLDPNIPNPAAGGRPGVLRFGGNYAPDAISCKCSQIIKTDYKKFGPRIGFAFAFNDKTVFRGGYGIMYSRRGAVGGRNSRSGTGFIGINASPALVSPNTYDPAFYWQNGIPTYIKGPIYDQTYQTGFNGTGAGGTVTYGDPNSVPPRYTNWNLSVQRSLTSSLVVTAAYVGSTGKSLADAAPGKWSNQLDPKYLVLGTQLNNQATAANVTAAALIVPGLALPYPTFVGTISQMLRPFPQYSGVNAIYNNDGQTNYHAMQLTFQQRLAHGLTFNLNYTYSKALGTINGFRSAYVGEKSLSTTDQPHVLNSFYSYELPFGKGKTFDSGNTFVNALIGGWSLSGVTRAASGTPLGAFTANCTLAGAGVCWANYNPTFSGDPRLKGDGGVTPFINVAAFSQPAAFTYGNTNPTGTYGLRLPHFFNQDLSISRNFKVRENLKFVFGADAFNLFNNVRLGGYNLNIANVNFGKASTQLNLPRVFQLKFRIEM